MSWADGGFIQTSASIWRLLAVASFWQAIGNRELFIENLEDAMTNAYQANRAPELAGRFNDEYANIRAFWDIQPERHIPETTD